MEVGSPEWIEASLAKLDDLERQRAEREAALESAHDPLTLKQHNDALARLDAEIKTLYAQLEAVAEDDDEDEDDAGSGAEAPRATEGDDELSAPHISAFADPVAPAAAPAAAPIAEPIAAAADNPFGSPSSAPSAGGGFDAIPAPVLDEDLEPPGSGAKWMFVLVVVLLGAGVGGYFAWQNMQKNKAPEAKPDAGPEKVIKAAEIPEDTEEPNAVKGGDATISPTANPDGGDDDGGSSSKKATTDKKKKPLELKGGGDPLGGDPLG